MRENWDAIAEGEEMCPAEKILKVITQGISQMKALNVTSVVVWLLSHVGIFVTP